MSFTAFLLAAAVLAITPGPGIVFFLAFLPQFVKSAELILPQVMLLGSICVLLNTLADVLAVFAANRLLDTGIVHAVRARLMLSVSGITMIGLGVLLALTRRHT